MDIAIIIITAYIGIFLIIRCAPWVLERTSWHKRKMCWGCGYHEHNRGGKPFGSDVCPKCGEPTGQYSDATIEVMRWVGGAVSILMPLTWLSGCWEVKGDKPEPFDEWFAELKQCEKDNV